MTLDEALTGVCETVLENTNAVSVSLVDDHLHEIAHAGADLPDELELPRPAVELVQHVGKHQVYTTPVAVGMLVVVFGRESSLGLVRLRARHAQREIEELVASPPPPDGGGPSGAAAAAVAWPRRKS